MTAFLQKTWLAITLAIATLPALGEQVVISEIMYHPKENLPEYIEITNITATPFDISEWSFTEGISFDFPAFSAANPENTILEAFSSIIITSSDVATFNEAYSLPPGLPIRGPWTGSLSNAGERITLTDKNGVDLCTVRYNDRGEWPVSPDGTGHSLVLANPDRNIDDPRVWTASTSSNPVPGGGIPSVAEEPFENPVINLNNGFTLIDYDSKWDYNDANTVTGTEWQSLDYDFSDQGWVLEEAVSNNGGIYGRENDAVIAPGIGTLIDISGASRSHAAYFFRKEFSYQGSSASGVSITLDSILDDGGHYYLNGNSLAGFGDVPANADPDFFADGLNNAVEVLNLATTNGSSLQQGVNVIACQVHNTTVGSGDLLFGARIRITYPTGNDLLINEVLPATNGVGFVEVYNTTSAPINLNGWFLAEDPLDLNRFQISENITVPAFGLASVGYLESQLSIKNETTIYLTRPDGITITDAISAQIPFDGRSLGRKPLGANEWFLFAQPSQNDANVSTDSPTHFEINEVHFDGNGICDWVEIFNPSGETIDPSGLFLASTKDFSDRVPLATGAAPRGVGVTDTSFDASAERISIYLINSENQVLDSVSIRTDLADASAFPDGSNDFFRTSGDTRDALNNPARNIDIVINEIMPDPPSKEREGEFIELYNRGNTTVDLSGWSFSDGVSFTFPPGTTMAPDSYLVIVASLAHSSATNVAGEYSGSLSNRSELLRLEDALGNTADEVLYYNGGEWPELTNAEGSSLELKNPFMDNSVANSWIASDESNKTSFQSFSVTGTYLQNSSNGGGKDFLELHMKTVDNAHIAIRNISLIANMNTANNFLENRALQLSQDGTGIEGWLCQGSHHRSTVIGDEFHLISDGVGDEKANHCEIDVPDLRQDDPHTLTFEARWISGAPILQFETWDRSFGDTFHLTIPTNLGTPGAPNSGLIAMPVPTISKILHAPAVPTAADIVTITANVGDADNVAVFHRLDDVNDSNPWVEAPMFDDGLTGGDEIAGDGIYTANVSDYQSGGLIIQFYVQATSAGGTTIFPISAPREPAMWIVDNTQIPDDLRTSRFIICARDICASITSNSKPNDGESAAFDFAFPRLSNAYFNCTFISNEKDIIYNAEIRKRGSPFESSRPLGADFSRAKWKTPADQRFRGFGKRILDDDATGDTAYHNRIVRYWLYLLGHPSNENEIIRSIVNNNTPILVEEVEPNGSDFLRRHWQDSGEADLYRIDDEFFLRDDGRGEDQRVEASWNFEDSYEIIDYHATWNKRSRRNEFDYDPLISWFEMVGENSASRSEIERAADIDMMAALVVARGWADDWDNFTKERGKNGYFMRRPDDNKWMLLQWDSDQTFRDPNETFIGVLPGVRNFFDRPYVRQRVNYYLGEMIDNYTKDSPRLASWLNAEERASDSYSVPIIKFNQWNNNRMARALQEIGGDPQSTLTITSGDGSTDTTTQPLYTLTGTHPYRTYEVRIQDHPEAELTFVDRDNWSLAGIQLMSGSNTLTVEAVDQAGELVDSRTFTVTKTGNSSPFVSLDADPRSYNIDAARALSLDASDSFDPEGGALTFAWSCSAGCNLSSPSTSTTVASFDGPGIHLVTLNVSDPEGNATEITREIIAYGADRWIPFSAPILPDLLTPENVIINTGDFTESWYSLVERENSLTMKVEGDSALPFRHNLPQFPAVTQTLPDSENWTIQTDVSLASIQRGEFITGIRVVLDGISYAIGMEDGSNIVVRSSDGSSSTLEATRLWSERETTMRISRRGNMLLFEYRLEPGVWTQIFQLTLSSSPTVQTASLFAATDDARDLTVTFDYALVVDPALMNSSLQDLRITEVMYNPENDNQEAEFLELHNTGGSILDLTGVNFDDGDPFSEAFSISSGTLAAGAYAVLVRDQATFEEVYGTDIQIIAEWSDDTIDRGGLSNGGEVITMRDPAGLIIQQFEYNDASDWPGSADGDGFSLEIFDLAGNYDAGGNWRPSGLIGGSPGSVGDFDGDGLNNDEELALGTQIENPDSDGDGIDDGTEVSLNTNPLVPDTEFEITGISTGSVAGTLDITWESIPNVNYVLETSTTLDEADGWDEIKTISATSELTTTDVTIDVLKRFYRLRVSP